MKAFTIVAGEYAQLAAITVPAFEWATGLQVEVLAPQGNPYRAKLTLPAAEQYLFFDCDVVFLRKWSPPEVPAGTFAATTALKRERNLPKVLEQYPADALRFVNTGLFIADSSHAAVMTRAAEIMDTGISELHEETALNIALQEHGTRVQQLTRVNRQSGWQVGDLACHVCYRHTVDAKLTEVHRLLRHFAAKELRELLFPAVPEQKAS